MQNTHLPPRRHRLRTHQGRDSLENAFSGISTRQTRPPPPTGPPDPWSHLALLKEEGRQADESQFAGDQCHMLIQALRDRKAIQLGIRLQGSHFLDCSVFRLTPLTAFVQDRNTDRILQADIGEPCHALDRMQQQNRHTAHWHTNQILALTHPNFFPIASTSHHTRVFQLKLSSTEDRPEGSSLCPCSVLSY